MNRLLFSQKKLHHRRLKNGPKYASAQNTVRSVTFSKVAGRSLQLC